MAEKGIIYMAKNKTNGKMYIGKTIRSLKYRMIEHKYVCYTKGLNTHFYNAIRKWGIDGFDWNILWSEFCSSKKLDEMEITYIKLFNSTNKNIGYNTTVGGDGRTLLCLDDNEVIEKYSELHTLQKTADFFGTNINRIFHILKKHNIKATGKQIGKSTLLVDIKTKEPYKFDTTKAAAEFIIKVNKSKSTVENLSAEICKRTCNGNGFMNGYMVLVEKEVI